jgi:hypothetical protein
MGNWRNMIMTVTNGATEEVVHYETDTKNIVDWKEGYKSELKTYAGKPNGVATLDNNKYVPEEQLYYAMKGIGELQTKLPQEIANATQNLVKSVYSDVDKVIHVVKANGVENTMAFIKKSKFADESGTSKELINVKINNQNELDNLTKNCTFYGYFNISGIPIASMDWTGWQVGTSEITSIDNGQMDQYISYGERVFHRWKDDNTGWKEWKELQNRTSWTELEWTGQHNTIDTWIPVFRNNKIDYVLKNEISGAGFSDCSLAERGYQKFPNGLILQWGRDNLGNNSLEGPSQWFTFPKPFNSVCFHVYLTDMNHDDEHGAWHDNILQLWEKNKDGFNIYKQGPHGPSTTLFTDFCWLAIGV